MIVTVTQHAGLTFLDLKQQQLTKTKHNNKQTKAQTNGRRQVPEDSPPEKWRSDCHCYRTCWFDLSRSKNNNNKTITNKQANKQASKQASKQTNKQASKQANKQTNKQRNRPKNGDRVQMTVHPKIGELIVTVTVTERDGLTFLDLKISK